MMINNNSGNRNWDRSDEGDSLRHQFESSVTLPCQSGSTAHRPNATFLQISSNRPHQDNKDPDHTVFEKYMPNTKDRRSFETKFNTKERVKVQHLQTHSKLQNNRWNHHPFCGDSVDRGTNMPNINGSCNQKDSALREHRLNDEKVSGSSELGSSFNVPCASNGILDPACDNSKETDGDERTSYVCRTEDQEHAFRRIEDVHNYSKLNRNTYTNDSSNSSLREDDVEDDEGDEDEVIDESLETYGFFKCQQKKRVSKESWQNNAYNVSTANGSNFKTRDQLQSERSYDAPETPSRPDHHARRPMNAFLIFCKRHRAIVKDRYKSLENRAITKILGDWWASLDLNEKKCYTSLAQQNKDAFFNANPNFKWYKLPAPPLRTLHTRPNNTEHCTLDVTPNDDRSTEEHVFKLADEAQMGDLSTLIEDRDVGAPHVTQAGALKSKELVKIADADSLNYIWPEFGMDYKRAPMMNMPNISYSEEGLASKKTSRQCKGRIYRELINSGQISAVPKKKVLKADYIDQFDERNCFIANGVAIQASTYPSCNSRTQPIKREHYVGSRECINPLVDSEINFDLDEKISELPALSLDTYLQRKRSNQKKKKTTSKKRFPSLSRRNQFKATTNVTSSPVTPLSRSATQAVGSQKRKARKESITRRDVSAIENEVASLLSFQADVDAISCSSNYFCNDSSLTWTTTSLATNTASDFGTTGFLLRPRADELSSLLNNANNNNNSSTSDLLILAEAAAKRTEISN